MIDTNKFMHAIVRMIFSQIHSDVIGNGTNADGIHDGSDIWSHPSTNNAIMITEMLGMSWYFHTWEDTERLAHNIIDGNHS